MKGYKAFKKGLICDPTGHNPYQYAENTVFEQEEEADICNSGFHFCPQPLDVLEYYPLVDENGDMTEFAEVEALDKCKTDDKQKYCTKKIKIGAKIGFPALVQASIDFELEKVPNGENKVKTTSKNNAKIGSSGDSAKITSNGKYSVICCAGNNSIAKGKKGSWITLSEWGYDKKEKAYIPICVKTEQIDGEKIKEDTFYKLENGKFVECEG
nr:MAG TPA: hypothetical protein [Caudoviricetes sp.]